MGIGSGPNGSFVNPSATARSPAVAENRSPSAHAPDVGGCQPAAIHSHLTMTAIALLSCRTTTVARPQAERPTMWRPPSLQAKCSSHRCRLGLKSGTDALVTGSTPRVLAPLKLLQSRHESQRLSSSLAPPPARGTM